MVCHSASGRAIVTENLGFCVLELWWHGLAHNGKLQVAKLRFHVDKAFAAKRAFVRRSQVLLIALFMYTMATHHENYPFW